MTFPNYEYTETANKDTLPDPVQYGTEWEYWSDRITPDEHVAVWRRVVQDEGLFN